MGVWKDKGLFEIREQRLADQVKLIKQNLWLTTVELDELYRSIMWRGNPGGNARQDQDVGGTVAAGLQRAMAVNISDMEDRCNEDDIGWGSQRKRWR